MQLDSKGNLKVTDETFFICMRTTGEGISRERFEALFPGRKIPQQFSSGLPGVTVEVVVAAADSLEIALRIAKDSNSNRDELIFENRGATVYASYFVVPASCPINEVTAHDGWQAVADAMAGDK